MPWSSCLFRAIKHWLIQPSYRTEHMSPWTEMWGMDGTSVYCGKVPDGLRSSSVIVSSCQVLKNCIVVWNMRFKQRRWFGTCMCLVECAHKGLANKWVMYWHLEMCFLWRVCHSIHYTQQHIKSWNMEEEILTHFYC